MPRKTTCGARPHIILGETDADRLFRLAVQMEKTASQAAGLLLAEIERAEVRPDSRVPADVVRMNSVVRFIDEAHGQSRSVTLVYPSEADIGAGRISVLTPVGAGLIGLAAGQSIVWPDREGHQRTLRIIEVQPNGTLQLAATAP